MDKYIYDNVKKALSDNIPELGKILTHWQDPFAVNKNQTVMLPEKSSRNAEKFNFSIRLVVSIVEKNADLIPYMQMEIFNKLESFVNSNEFDYIVQNIDCEYLNPIPQAPIVGLLDITLDLVDYKDDCN